jgi:heme exporter protein D
MGEFFAMDGYGWYIWPTYAVTLGFMIWIVVTTLRGLAADRKVLAELEKNAPHRARRRGETSDSSPSLRGVETSDA